MKENEKQETENFLFPPPFTFQEKEEKERERTTTTTKRARENEIDIQKFIDYFNKQVTDHHSRIPKIQRIEGKRREALNARCREYKKPKLIEMIQHAVHSTFLNGGGNKGWVATIDWLLAPSNFLKVIEGNYDDHRGAFKPYTLDEARRAAARIIEQERHLELQRKIEERQKKCVTYEKYLQMLKEGLIKPPEQPPSSPKPETLQRET